MEKGKFLLTGGAQQATSLVRRNRYCFTMDTGQARRVGDKPGRDGNALRGIGQENS